MFFVFSILFVEFPSKQDALIQPIKNKKGDINIASSGALGFYINGKCLKSNETDTLNNNPKVDWCSNVAEKKEKPWISYSLKNKAMKLTGYSIRNGCCYNSCCCIDDQTFVDGDIYCCCRMYSFSLYGSEDNSTWELIHKVEKDEKFYVCMTKTYDFPMTKAFNFVRFVMDEEMPGCPRCMAINQIEFYGKEVASSFINANGDDDNEESVSIIGKVKREE